MQLEIQRREGVTGYAQVNGRLILALVRLEEVAATLPIGKNKQSKRMNGGLRRSHSFSGAERIPGGMLKDIKCQ